MMQVSVKNYEAIEYKWVDVDDVSNVELHKHFDEAHAFIGTFQRLTESSVDFLTTNL